MSKIIVMMTSGRTHELDVPEGGSVSVTEGGQLVLASRPLDDAGARIVGIFARGEWASAVRASPLEGAE